MDTTVSTFSTSTTTKPPGIMEPMIGKVIISIAAPILFLVGMIGNILIIVVIRRGALPSIATTLSFTYLAVVDMIVLVFALVELWLFYYDIYITDFNHTWCAIHAWLIYVGTVPTFNSCTKFAGSPGIIHDRTPGCHPVSLVWMHR